MSVSDSDIVYGGKDEDQSGELWSSFYVMAHEYAKSFYGSEAWHKCRLGYIRHRRSVDGGMCEECHEQPGYIVHHKKELSPRNINDDSITLSWDNLMYVCKGCHDKIHDYCGRGNVRQRRVEFDANGEPRLAL